MCQYDDDDAHTMDPNIFVLWAAALAWTITLTVSWWLTTLPDVSDTKEKDALDVMRDLWSVFSNISPFSPLLGATASNGFITAVTRFALFFLALLLFSAVLPAIAHFDKTAIEGVDTGIARDGPRLRDETIYPLMNSARIIGNSVIPTTNLVNVVTRSVPFVLFSETVKCIRFDGVAIVESVAFFLREIVLVTAEYLSQNVLASDNEFDLFRIMRAAQSVLDAIFAPMTHCWCNDLSFILEWIRRSLFVDTSLPAAFHHWFNHLAERWKLAFRTIGEIVVAIEGICPDIGDETARQECLMAREPRFDRLTFHYQESGIHITDWIDNTIRNGFELILNASSVENTPLRPPETARIVRGSFAIWRIIRLFVKIIFNPRQLLNSFIELIPRNLKIKDTLSTVIAGARKTFFYTSWRDYIPSSGTIDTFSADFKSEMAQLATHIDTIAFAGFEHRVLNLDRDYSHWYNTSEGFIVFFDAFGLKIADDTGCFLANLHNGTVLIGEFFARLSVTLPRAETDTIPFLENNGSRLAEEIGRDLLELSVCFAELITLINPPLAQTLRDLIRLFDAFFVIIVDFIASILNIFGFLEYFTSQQTLDDFNNLFDVLDSLAVSIGNVVRQFSFSPGSDCQLRDLFENPSDDGISRDVDYFCMGGGFIDATIRIVVGLARAGIIGLLQTIDALIDGELTNAEIDALILDPDAPLNLDRVIERFDDLTWTFQFSTVGPILVFIPCPGDGDSVGHAWTSFMQSLANGTAVLGLGFVMRGINTVLRVTGIALKGDCGGEILDCICPFLLLLWDTFVAAPTIFVLQFARLLECFSTTVFGFFVSLMEGLWDEVGWENPIDNARDFLCVIFDILVSVITMVVFLFTGQFEEFWNIFIEIIDELLIEFIEDIFDIEGFTEILEALGAFTVCVANWTVCTFDVVIGVVDWFFGSGIASWFDRCAASFPEFDDCNLEIPVRACPGLPSCFSILGDLPDVQLGACIFGETESSCAEGFLEDACVTGLSGEWLGVNTICPANFSSGDQPISVQLEASTNVSTPPPRTFQEFIEQRMNAVTNVTNWIDMRVTESDSPCHNYWHDIYVAGHNSTTNRDAFMECITSVLLVRKWSAVIFFNWDPQRYVVPPRIWMSSHFLRESVVAMQDLLFAFDVEARYLQMNMSAANISTDVRHARLFLQTEFGINKTTNFSRAHLALWVRRIGHTLIKLGWNWPRMVDNARWLLAFVIDIYHVPTLLVSRIIHMEFHHRITPLPIPPATVMSGDLPPRTNMTERIYVAAEIWAARFNHTLTTISQLFEFLTRNMAPITAPSHAFARVKGLHYLAQRRLAEARAFRIARSTTIDPDRNSTAEAIRNCQGIEVDFTTFPSFNMCVAANEIELDFGIHDLCFNCTVLQRIIDIWAVNAEATANDYECPLRFETDLNTFCDIYKVSGTDGRILFFNGVDDIDDEDCALELFPEFESILNLTEQAVELFGGDASGLTRSVRCFFGSTENFADRVLDLIERAFVCDYVTDVRCNSGARGLGAYPTMIWIVGGILTAFVFSKLTGIPLLDIPQALGVFVFIVIAGYLWIGFNMSPACAVPNVVGAFAVSRLTGSLILTAAAATPMFPTCFFDDLVCPAAQLINVTCYQWPGIEALFNQSACPDASTNFRRSVQQCSDAPFRMQGLRVMFFYLERVFTGLATFITTGVSPVATVMRAIIPNVQQIVTFPSGSLDDPVWQACGLLRVPHLLFGLLYFYVFLLVGTVILGIARLASNLLLRLAIFIATTVGWLIFKRHRRERLSVASRAKRSLSARLLRLRL